MSNYAFGHALRIKSGKAIDYRFQNFFVGKDIKYKDQLSDSNVKLYSFVPFGFSGVTVTRTGDGLEASIVFPNNNLSRKWVIQAVEEFWLMEVDVLIIDSDDKDANHNRVHTYTGQVVSGQWDNVSANLQLSTVLDAVGTDIPRRSLTRELIGNLPVTNNVRLQ